MDDDEDIPEAFFCPISGELLSDPVTSPGGHTYERRTIEGWLQNHDTSPFTRERLSVDSLNPNRTVKTLLDDWRQREAQYAAASTADPLQSYTIPFEELTLGLGDLGQGSFKFVEKGSYRGREVAVAAMRDGMTHMDREISLMGRLGRHPHVVTFHGVAKDPEGKERLVTELASHGSLSDVLADLDDREAAFQPPVLLAVAQQVSSYLKRCRRDLGEYRPGV